MNLWPSRIFELLQHIPDLIFCKIEHMLARMQFSMRRISRVWPTADHVVYGWLVSIDKIWRQSAVTAQGETQHMQMAGDYSDCITCKMK